MSELIWYSIPGAIVIFALYLVSPSICSSQAVVIIASTPVLGYVVHQLYRTIFELFRGWESSRRPVLKMIRDTYNLDSSERNSPFLIWETTLYSDKIPNAFRDHNRASWHYVMSFRSICFASVISGFIIACFPKFWSYQSHPVLIICGFLAIGIIFWLKGKLTYLSLTRQECAAFKKYNEAFKCTRERIAMKLNRKNNT